VTNELVQDNFDCFKLISKAIKLTGFSSEENLLQKPRKGLETRAIVACGGKYTLCYLPEKDEWKRLADGLSERNLLTQMLSYREQLYAFQSHGKVERYDPMVNGWSTLDLFTALSAKIAVVRGEIYSIEINTSMRKSTIKTYSNERCSWETVLSSHEGCRGGSCLVAAGNHLYVCGGMTENEGVTKAERFDTVENKWEKIANMQQKRWDAFGVAREGKIFLAGGRPDQRSYLKTCETFNILTNEWQLIGSLRVPRAYGSMVCLKGVLYVLGGTSNRSQGEVSVECYYPSEDKWIKKTTIPGSNKYGITGCVLKLSKGVLDKLDVITE